MVLNPRVCQPFQALMIHRSEINSLTTIPRNNGQLLIENEQNISQSPN